MPRCPFTPGKATMPVTTRDPESRRFSEGDSTAPRTRVRPGGAPRPPHSGRSKARSW